MTAASLLDDWLLARDPIVERIKAEVPAFRRVASINELGALAELEAKSRQTPAAFVVFDGERLGGGAASGASESGAQRWIVVIAVRSARAGGDGSALDDEAGPLIAKTLRALKGFKPLGQASRGLQRVTAPRPGYSVNFAFYPLAYELPFTA